MVVDKPLVMIGTPGQQVSLQIDTGSTDIWVEVAGSNACENTTNPCLGGTYDNTLSSTYQFVSNNFYIPYGDGTYAAGVFADETFNIGGTIPITVDRPNRRRRGDGRAVWCRD